MEGLHLGILTKKQAEYIITDRPRIQVFLYLPKLHRGGFPTSFRPIVSGISSLNKNLYEWVDSLLQPLVKQIPGYLKDVKDVLAILNYLSCGQDYCWITADVSSLYSIITHDLACVAVNWFLETYSNFSTDLKNFLLLAIFYLLKHNFFAFDDIFYLDGGVYGCKIFPVTCKYIHVVVGIQHCL